MSYLFSAAFDCSSIPMQMALNQMGPPNNNKVRRARAIGTVAPLASALGRLSAPSQAVQIFIDHTDELNVTGPFSAQKKPIAFMAIASYSEL